MNRVEHPAPLPVGRASPTAWELFTPKFVTILREGYGLADLKADALAGLTVAVVALPLCMAIAIASGLAPETGLYTGIIGGFLISLLGGSAALSTVLDRVGSQPRIFMLDFEEVPLIDSTAANTLRSFAKKQRSTLR
jgi:MFS superfamily sulfate permease-like transporter